MRSWKMLFVFISVTLSFLVHQSVFAAIDTRLVEVSNQHNVPSVGKGTLVVDVEAKSDGSAESINAFQDAFQLDTVLRAQNPVVSFSGQLFPSAQYTTTEGYAATGRVRYIYTYSSGERGIIGTDWTKVVTVTIEYDMTDATSTIAWYDGIPLYYDTDSGNTEITGSEEAIPGSLIDFPLPVQLSSFTTEVGDGFVKLIWTTESEVDNLGFHIYRSLSEDGEYERITAERIEGMGASSTQHKYTFRDPNVTPGITYWYKLEDVAFDGTRTMHGAISVTSQLRVREEVVVVLPDAYALSRCYPNPFNPSTSVRYQLPEPGEVRLAIYDVLGQEMRVLVSETQPAGWYRVMWDGRDEVGQPVSSGVYLYRLEVGEEFLQTRKMVVVR